MRVRATRVGYYGLDRRQVGEEFEIADASAFSKKWMEKVVAERAERAADEPDKKPVKRAGRSVI